MNLLYFLLKSMKLPMLVIKAISFNKAAIVSANSNNSRTQFLGMTKNEALKRLGNINLPGN